MQSVDETDERVVGDDGMGTSDKLGDGDIADHLQDEEEGLSLGDQIDHTIHEATILNRAIRNYLMQEAAAAASANSTKLGPETPVSSAEPNTGFYSAFDMGKDHSSTWYKSPGQPMGSAGDPYRSEDAAGDLGMHGRAGGGDESPSQLAPQIWQLSAGGDTSKVLGANAKPNSGGGDSGNGSKKSEAPGGGEDVESEDEVEDDVT